MESPYFSVQFLSKYNVPPSLPFLWPEQFPQELRQEGMFQGGITEWIY